MGKRNTPDVDILMVEDTLITTHGRPARMSGHGLVLAAAVLWGTTGTAQALAPEGTSPAAVGAVRLAVGGAALLIVAAGRGALPGSAGWPILATVLAGASMAAYQPFFFAAVAKTGVAVGTIVAIGSAPILAGALALLVRGEQPSRRWTVATALAVLGCGLLFADSGNLSVDAYGVVLALGAGAAYATYAVVSKQLLEKQAPDAAMAVVFCLGAIFLSPLLFTADLSWLTQPRGLAVALHLGLFATAAAYALFARGLVSIPVATAVTLSLAEPLTAGTLGVVLLGERLTPATLLGIGLVLSGLILISLGARRRPRSTRSDH